jgi:hypothetical protein
MALLLLALIGLSSLAFDLGRLASLQTQLQAVADALAIAGARELDQAPDAQTRATSAINNMISNGLTDLGYTGSISHTITFYSALEAAASGYGGTIADSSADSKFVGVSLTPVSIASTINMVSPTLSSRAQAIAGFTSRAVCDMPPVFICNPYETAGMSDAAATQALRTAMANPAVRRKMMRMDMTQTSPGHFGYLVPPDKLNGASSLRDWIAKTHPKTCYESKGVDLNTGLKTAVTEGFNVRFDLYQNGMKYSADYAPAVNVRKGFMPGTGGGGGNKWCGADSPKNNPYYTLPIVTTNGTTQSGGSAAKTIISMGTTAGMIATNPISGARLQSGTSIATVASASSVTISQNAQTAGATTLTSMGATSGLPLDSNIYAAPTTIFGNGDWNCSDYWTVNHTAAAPSGCTKTSPTISRYEVYRYEIANNLVNDWSAGLDGTRTPNVAGNSAGKSESGAPYCAGTGNGVDPSLNPKQTDRRVIYVAVINCLAHSDLITGGATADNIPVADFGKFFMTQPIGISDSHVDPTSIYGEMSGLVGSLDQVVIMNQVQLYR